MPKYPMIPILATVLKVCSILVFAAALLLAINGTMQTGKSIKQTREQITQAEKIIKENPMYAAQYGTQLADMKDSMKPMHIAMAYIQNLILFIVGVVLLAFLWGISDLFMAVRAIECNIRAAIAGSQPLPVSEKATAETVAPVAG